MGCMRPAVLRTLGGRYGRLTPASCTTAWDTACWTEGRDGKRLSRVEIDQIFKYILYGYT